MLEVYTSTILGRLFTIAFFYVFLKEFSHTDSFILFGFYLVFIDSCLDTLFDYIVLRKRNYDNLKIGAELVALVVTEYVAFSLLRIDNFYLIFLLSVLMNIAYKYLKWLRTQMV